MNTLQMVRDVQYGGWMSCKSWIGDPPSDHILTIRSACRESVGGDMTNYCTYINCKHRCSDYLPLHRSIDLNLLSLSGALHSFKFVDKSFIPRGWGLWALKWHYRLDPWGCWKCSIFMRCAGVMCWSCWWWFCVAMLRSWNRCLIAVTLHFTTSETPSRMSVMPLQLSPRNSSMRKWPPMATSFRCTVPTDCLMANFLSTSWVSYSFNIIPCISLLKSFTLHPNLTSEAAQSMSSETIMHKSGACPLKDANLWCIWKLVIVCCGAMHKKTSTVLQLHFEISKGLGQMLSRLQCWETVWRSGVRGQPNSIFGIRVCSETAYSSPWKIQMTKDTVELCPSKIHIRKQWLYLHLQFEIGNGWGQVFHI